MALNDQIQYDLAIIGGGINGAAIARDASLRGMKVLLLEKTDFGAGASSKTSKLVHGGLRYLEHLQFSLVQESLEERALLLQNAPHLVKPLPFLLPLYSHDKYYGWQVSLGLSLYDFFGRKDRLPRHWSISKSEIISHLPGIREEGLLKGFCYFECQMNDTRLLLENILAAEEAGAMVLNYAPVTQLSFDQGKVNGLFFKLPNSDTIQKIRAHRVVNAAGPWCDQVTQMDPSMARPLLSPTKGCHLVFPRWTEQALILRAPQDGRIFFIIPWGESEGVPLTLVGTTDTFFEGDPSQAAVEAADQEYLLRAVNFYFPQFKLTPEATISSFAAVRPLAAVHRKDPPSSISRLQHIHVSPSGLISIYGGKYTAFRKIAEQVVDHVVRTLPANKQFAPCVTRTLPLPAAAHPIYQQQLMAAGLTTEQVKHLIINYGSRSTQIAELIQQDRSLIAPLCSKHLHLKAELCYAIQKEHVKTLEDWFFRRTAIGYSPCKGIKCLEASREILERDKAYYI